MRIFIALLLAAGLSPAATYYVANTGSDAANGTSTSTPWQTIAHVNAQTFSPGDSILFNRGDTWREALTLGQSGSSGNPIAFGSYGSGAQPIITGANLATWTQGSGAAAQETGGVFSSGFETAAFADWSGTTTYGATTVNRSATNPAHGSFDMQIAADGTDNRITLNKSFTAFTSGNTYYTRFYLNTPTGSLGASKTWIALIFNIAGSPAFHLQLSTNASGNLSSCTLFGDSTNTGGTLLNNAALTGYVMNAWNYIEIAYTVGTSGNAQMFVNGTSIGTSATANTSGAAGINSINFGNTNFGGIFTASASIYADDFRISTSGPIGAFSAGIPTTVWSTPQTTNPWLPSFSGQPGSQKGSIASLTAANQWYWDGATTLYVYSASSPATVVEIPARSYAISSSGGVNYVNLSGLDIRGAQLYGLYCFTPNVNGCSNLTLDSDTVDLNYSNGIMILSGTSDFSRFGILRNSTLKNNGSSGIKLTGYWSDWLIDNNQVSQNCLQSGAGSEQTFCGGIYGFSSSGNDGTGSVIQHNTVHDNGYSGANVDYGVGVWTDTTNGVWVRNNISYNNNSTGIWLEKTINGKATYNTIYNNAVASFSAGLSVASGQGHNSTNNLVANNTIYGGYWGLALQPEDTNGTMTGNQILDNIAVNPDGSKAALFVDTTASNDGTHSSGNVFSNNAFGSYGATQICYAGACTAYAGFDIAYGSATHSVSGDAQLNNPGSSDFTLKSISPARNAGIAISGISQQVSELVPDIGAIEYTTGKLGTLSTSQLGNRYKAVTR